MKKFSFIVCFAVVLSLLTFTFSGTSFAKQTRKQRCVRSCGYEQKNCLTSGSDNALCSNEYQTCVSSCKSGSDSSSAAPQGQSEQPVQQKQQTPKKSEPVLY
ncbi:MAG: hypothetical protein WC373_01005 [Smithella sp.]